MDFDVVCCVWIPIRPWCCPSILAFVSALFWKAPAYGQSFFLCVWVWRCWRRTAICVSDMWLSALLLDRIGTNVRLWFENGLVVWNWCLVMSIGFVSVEAGLLNGSKVAVFMDFETKRNGCGSRCVVRLLKPITWGCCVNNWVRWDLWCWWWVLCMVLRSSLVWKQWLAFS